LYLFNKAINANKLLILSWQTRLKKQFDKFFVLLQTKPTITETKKTRRPIDPSVSRVDTGTGLLRQPRKVSQITKLHYLSLG